MDDQHMSFDAPSYLHFTTFMRKSWPWQLSKDAISSGGALY